LGYQKSFGFKKDVFSITVYPRVFFLFCKSNGFRFLLLKILALAEKDTFGKTIFYLEVMDDFT